MRCRNCGADNDDKRYICEVCGSPLYEEGEIPVGKRQQHRQIENPPVEQRTQTFSALNPQNDVAGRQQRPVRQYNNAQNNVQRSQQGNNDANRPEPEPENDENKKNIIVIAILVVILIAVIASVVAIAHNKNEKENDSDASELTRISTTLEEDATEDKTTKKETTTEATTETTTETTTESVWIINTSSSGGGETEGGGEYSNGDEVTLIARADDGYVFDGWYSNGIKVSSDTQYTFKANENASFSAVFNPVETQPVVTDTTMPTEAEVNFGE